MRTAARTWRTRGDVGGGHTRRCSVRRVSLAFFVLTGGIWYLAFLLRASQRHQRLMEQANRLSQVPQVSMEQAVPYTSQQPTPVASGALRAASHWWQRAEVSTDTPEDRELDRQQASARRPDATAASSDTRLSGGRSSACPLCSLRAGSPLPCLVPLGV